MSHDASAELQDMIYGLNAYEPLGGRDATGYEARRMALFLSRNVVVPRTDLPEVTLSEHGSGLVTAIAQEYFQPSLRFSAKEGDKSGEWSRKIALANLAIAEAIQNGQGAIARRRAELAEELFHNGSYPSLNDGAKAAIDRIIDLESERPSK